MRYLAKLAREGTVENMTARNILAIQGEQVDSANIREIGTTEAKEALTTALEQGQVAPSVLAQIGVKLRNVYTSTIGSHERTNGVTPATIENMSKAVGAVLGDRLVAALELGPLEQPQIIGISTIQQLTARLTAMVDQGDAAGASRIVSNLSASADRGTLTVDLGSDPVLRGDPTSNTIGFYETTFWKNAGIERPDGGQPAAATVPFQNDAGDQWYPAIDRASEYARSIGYQGVRFEGTGALARGLGRPPVNAIELQEIFLMTGPGESQSLGSVLPEAGHLQALKSTESLFGEFKGLIDRYHRNG